jgi:putative transposase
MQILQRKFGTLQSSYTRAINIQEKKTGSLFQQKFKMIELCEEHGWICFHYLHQNPIKAGLCDRFEDWIYSSYNEYYSNTADSVCNKRIAYNLLKINSDAQGFANQSKAVINNEEVLRRLEQSLKNE